MKARVGAEGKVILEKRQVTTIYLQQAVNMPKVNNKFQQKLKAAFPSSRDLPPERCQGTEGPHGIHSIEDKLGVTSAADRRGQEDRKENAPAKHPGPASGAPTRVKSDARLPSILDGAQTGGKRAQGAGGGADGRGRLDRRGTGNMVRKSGSGSLRQQWSYPRLSTYASADSAGDGARRMANMSLPGGSTNPAVMRLRSYASLGTDGLMPASGEGRFGRGRCRSGEAGDFRRRASGSGCRYGGGGGGVSPRGKGAGLDPAVVRLRSVEGVTDSIRYAHEAGRHYRASGELEAGKEGRRRRVVGEAEGDKGGRRHRVGGEAEADKGVRRHRMTGELESFGAWSSDDD